VIIIGIDPGTSGGIASRVGDTTWVIKMPDSPVEIAKEIQMFAGERGTCYLEKVHSMPGQGVVSSFKFGRNLGVLEGILAALQIRLEWVTPQTWQKALGCMSKGDKNVTKRKALELFPDIKVTHSTADALLICEYGFRKESGRIL